MSETCRQFAERWPTDYGTVDGEPRWCREADASNRTALRRFAREFGPVKLADLPTNRRFLPWARSMAIVAGVSLHDEAASEAVDKDWHEYE